MFETYGPAFLMGILCGAAFFALVALPYVLRIYKRMTEAQAALGLQAGASTVMEAQFQAAAIKALQTTQEQFLHLAQEKLTSVQKDSGYDLEKRQKAIADMVDPIGKTLKEVETRLEKLGQSGAVLDAHLKNFADDQKVLRAQTSALVHMMRNSSARGRWGEMQLSRTLELVGMVENIHFKQQFNLQTGSAGDGTQRPDFVIHLPGGLSVVIDVKTPLEPYWAMAGEGEQSLTLNDEQIKSFRDHLRRHVKELSAKEYWRQFNAPQFVVMFLPTEGLFSLAVSADKDLIEDAASANVILASPTTILGLLRVIMYAWQQQSLAENAQKIGDMATELQGRMGTFLDHLQKVGRNLGTAVNAYNAAVGAAESRVLPQVRKMAEYQGSVTSILPDVPYLDHVPRDMLISDDKVA